MRGLQVRQDDRARWGFIPVHPLGQLGGAVTLPLGGVSFHNETLSRRVGASVRVCGEQTQALG